MSRTPGVYLESGKQQDYMDEIRVPRSLAFRLIDHLMSVQNEELAIELADLIPQTPPSISGVQ